MHHTRRYDSPNLSFWLHTRMHPEHSSTHIRSPFPCSPVTLPPLLLLLNSDRRSHESTHARTLRCSPWSAPSIRDHCHVFLTLSALQPLLGEWGLTSAEPWSQSVRSRAKCATATSLAMVAAPPPVLSLLGKGGHNDGGASVASPHAWPHHQPVLLARKRNMSMWFWLVAFVSDDVLLLLTTELDSFLSV